MSEKHYIMYSKLNPFAYQRVNEKNTEFGVQKIWVTAKRTM